MAKIVTGSHTVPGSRKIGPSQIVKQGWIYQLPCLQVKPDVREIHHTIKPCAKTRTSNFASHNKVSQKTLDFVDNN